MNQSSKPEIEIAWAAGFFDGEGTTCAVKKTHSLSLTVGQVNRSNLERFKSAVGGIGEIGGSYQIMDRKPFFVYRAYGPKALTCIQILWPFLGREKQDQALAALISYSFRRASNRDLYEAGRCKSGHFLSIAGIYLTRTRGRECVACRYERHHGRRGKTIGPTAFELRIGIKEYVPPPIASTFGIRGEEYSPAVQT